MSVRSNGGFPDNVFGGIKKLIKDLSDKVATNTANIKTNATNIKNTSDAAGKKVVYSDFMLTVSGTHTINHGHGGTQFHQVKLTNPGYYPLGVVGYESDAVNEYNNTSMGPAIRDIYLNGHTQGSCMLNTRLFAANNQSWTYHTTYKAYILWVRIR